MMRAAYSTYAEPCHVAEPFSLRYFATISFDVSLRHAPELCRHIDATLF